MKKLDLWIDGTRYVIEDVEGRAEIRHASQPRAMGHTRCEASLDRLGNSFTFELKVEARD